MKNVVITVMALFVMFGCASGDQQEQIIPKSDMTVVEVYEEHVSKSVHLDNVHGVLRRPATDLEVGFDPYLQTNNRKPKYRKLDNPTLYLYFPPAINSAEGIPTPGWMSEISMYERDQYALPGEVAVEVRE